MGTLFTIPLPPGLGNITLPATNPAITGSANPLLEIIVRVINTVLLIGGALAVLAIIYAGVMYLTAGENTDQTEKAKKTITWTIIGMVMIAASILIVNMTVNLFSGNIQQAAPTTSAPIVSVSVNGLSGPINISQNTAALISWQSDNINSCTASGAWNGLRGYSGSWSTGVLSTTGSYTYTMTCQNSGNGQSATSSVVVNVIP